MNTETQQDTGENQKAILNKFDQLTNTAESERLSDRPFSMDVHSRNERLYATLLGMGLRVQLHFAESPDPTVGQSARLISHFTVSV